MSSNMRAPLRSSYYIVPAGGDERDALVRGNLWTATAEAATQYVQGMTAPNVQGRSGLEVILQDVQGNELFRCRYKSSAQRPHRVVDAQRGLSRNSSALASHSSARRNRASIDCRSVIPRASR